MSPWRLLLTRSADDSASTIAQLAEAGIYASAMPLIKIEPLPLSAQDQARLAALDGYQAVIGLSKPAVRLFMAAVHCLPVPPTQPAWFAVGPGTGALWADYGITAHWPATGSDSEALLAMPELAAALATPAPRALLVRGANGRQLLARSLAGQGVQVDELNLYCRLAIDYPSGTLAARVAAGQLNALVASSGQVLPYLRTACGGDWPRLAQLPLLVPSQRVAGLATALGFTQVIACQGADARALAQALQANFAQKG